MPAKDQGVDPKRYVLIPRTLVFITRDDRVLLIKGAPRKRLWANLYNGIGGHIEKGEGVLAAARRELWEETGLTASKLWLWGVVTVDTQDKVGIGIFVLRGECPHGELIDSSEGRLAWVPFDRALSLPLVEDLYTLLPMVLAAQSGDPPVVAHYTYDSHDKLVIQFGE